MEYICDCGEKYVPNPKYKDTRVKCDKCIKNIRASEVKKRAVKYLGGKCTDCGYDEYHIAFDFDHIKPREKSYKISGKAISLFRWKELKKELNKCQLRCSNCHRIRHYLEENGLERKK